MGLWCERVYLWMLPLLCYKCLCSSVDKMKPLNVYCNADESDSNFESRTACCRSGYSASVKRQKAQMYPDISTLVSGLKQQCSRWWDITLIYFLFSQASLNGHSGKSTNRFMESNRKWIVQIVAMLFIQEVTKFKVHKVTVSQGFSFLCKALTQHPSCFGQHHLS